jgi:hypothetical protein
MNDVDLRRTRAARRNYLIMCVASVVAMTAVGVAAVVLIL